MPGCVGARAREVGVEGGGTGVLVGSAKMGTVAVGWGEGALSSPQAIRVETQTKKKRSAIRFMRDTFPKGECRLTKPMNVRLVFFRMQAILARRVGAVH